jgi:hypothetical protein
MATVSLSGSVSTTTTNTLAYATWTGSSSSTYYYNGPGAGQTVATASASAKGSVYPATVTFPNATTVNGTQTVITGQQITAQFNYSGPGTVNASAIQWDIESQEGSSIVGGYTPTQRQGKIIPVNFYNNPSPSISFYDGIQDTVTVNATAPVTFPDGTTGTLKASNQIAVVRPTVTAATLNISNWHNFDPHPNDTSSALGAYEQWSNVQITMPPGFSGGTGCFAQMLNSSTRTDTRHTGVPYTQKVQLSNGTWSSIPTPCLDTNFPYPFAVQWQVSGTGSGEDQPSFFVAPPLAAGDTGRNDWYHAQGGDHFTTWVMFTPDASNSNDIWVPLSSFDWNWSNTADFLTTSSPAGWVDTPPFTGDHGTIAESHTWPTWNTYTPSGALAMHY